MKYKTSVVLIAALAAIVGLFFLVSRLSNPSMTGNIVLGMHTPTNLAIPIFMMVVIGIASYMYFKNDKK